MPITDIPILSMLRQRMEWHQERQRVLAENVANADTPNYRARDLAPPDFSHEMQAVADARSHQPAPYHRAGRRRLGVRRRQQRPLRRSARAAIR